MQYIAGSWAGKTRSVLRICIQFPTTQPVDPASHSDVIASGKGKIVAAFAAQADHPQVIQRSSSPAPPWNIISARPSDDVVFTAGKYWRRLASEDDSTHCHRAFSMWMKVSQAIATQ